VSGRVVILTGGVGGAKLVDGVARLLPPDDVTAIVNTGDDFAHIGLRISPDIDTLLYTLSGQANPAQGWGRKNETWQFMAALGSLGGDQWFQLGDGDMALHVLRTHALNAGTPLSTIIADFARRWGIGISILPATDGVLATVVETDEGVLPFQHYFVERRCEPFVRSIRFEGAESVGPAPGVIEAISDPTARAILIAPSNPFLSVDPILAVPGVRQALMAAQAPVVAVSPLVGGKAVKGPTVKIMAELGLPISALEIVRHYGDILSGIVLDQRDPPERIDLPTLHVDTLMHDALDRQRVARAALELADRLQ
jgi:LPPG:FO 2-phospho-L-lactate transferase